MDAYLYRAVARFLSWGVQLAERSEPGPRQPTVAAPKWLGSEGASPKRGYRAKSQENLAFSSYFGPQSTFNKDFN
jgi:hypothetical protein